MPPILGGLTSGIKNRFKDVFAPAINAVSSLGSVPEPKIYPVQPRGQATAPSADRTPATQTPTATAPLPQTPQAPQLDPRFAGMSPGAIADELENERRRNRARGTTTSDFTPDVTETAPSTALSPDNTTDGLLGLRSRLEEQLLSSFDVSESEKRAQEQLNAILEERAGIETEKRRAIRELEKNEDGLSEDALKIRRQQISSVYDAQLADVDIQQTAITNAVDVYKTSRSEALSQIQTIADLTGEEALGGLQTDPTTGRQFAYFRNPITGQISERDLGAVGIEDELLSVADAKALGVPYGTTMSQAQSMGIVPQDTSGGGDGGLFGLSPSQYFSAVNAARGFEDSPVGKEFAAFAGGYAGLQSIDPATKNAAQHQQIIFNFMKTLDPTSVVREGEYATAQKYAQSMVDRFGKSFTQALNGTGFLSEKAIKDIQQASKEYYDSRIPTYQQERARYVNYLAPVVGADTANMMVSDYSYLAPNQNNKVSDEQADSLIDSVSSQTEEPGVVESGWNFVKNLFSF